MKEIVTGGHTQREIAKRIGCTEGPVSMWLAGKNVPDAVNVGRLQDEYGIPAPAWGQRPQKPRRNGHSRGV